MEVLRHTLRRMVASTGTTVFVIVGALVVGFGVPLLWVYIASLIQGNTGTISAPLAAFTGTGIILSYWLVLFGAAILRGWLIRSSGQRAARGARDPWNRSLGEERYRPGEGPSDPVERLFVAATVLVGIAFLIWFAFFAGAPFPQNP